MEKVLKIVLLTMVRSSLCSVYITDHGHRRVIELSQPSGPCVVHSDRRTVQNMLQHSAGTYLQEMSLLEVNALGESCTDMSQISNRGGFIYPGTRWCGPGSIASSYNDLGPLREEDKCCRDHDNCPNQLEPGQCRYGICNFSLFTRSHCDCDNAFKQCLRNVNSDTANAIGTLYFNIVQVTCFNEKTQCPRQQRKCSKKMHFIGSSPFASVKKKFYRQKEEYVSQIVTGILSGFIRAG